MKKTTAPSPDEIASAALARLQQMADPAKAAAVQRYFKETVRSFGVAVPEVRRLASEVFSLVKETWTLEEAVELCHLLLSRPELEAKALAVVVLGRFRRQFYPGLLPIFKRWLENDYLANWASVDLFCPDCIGTMIERYPELSLEIQTWAFHPNRWVKRGSVVSFIKLAKNPEFLPVIYQIAASLFPVKDDLIHKAVGWLLREAGKTDPSQLEAFLLNNGPRVPRTTLRYAIEAFPAEKRRHLLSATKK